MQQKRCVDSIYSSELYLDFDRFINVYSKIPTKPNINFLFEMACIAGNVSIVNFLEREIRNNTDKESFFKKGLEIAAAHGRFNLFCYFYKKFKGFCYGWCLHIMYTLSSRNHFEIVDFLIEEDKFVRGYLFWSDIVERLTREGNLQSIEQIFQRNVKLSKNCVEKSFEISCMKENVELAEFYRQLSPFKFIYTLENRSIKTSFVIPSQWTSMFVLMYCLFYNNCHYYF